MLKMNMNSELIKKFYKIIKEIEVQIEAGNYVEAQALIDEAFKEFFRLGAKFFISLSEENLMDMIKTNNITDIHKCIIMSKLLMDEGKVNELLYGIEKSFYLYQKSLFMYIEAFLNIEGREEFIEFANDIQKLMGRLSEYKLSPKLQRKIIEYYLMETEYDKAENVLYELMDETFDDEIREYAISFYKALLLKEDSDLNIGRLPREEILESLNNLQ